jgi:hypothetical protein
MGVPAVGSGCVVGPSSMKGPAFQAPGSKPETQEAALKAAGFSDRFVGPPPNPQAMAGAPPGVPLTGIAALQSDCKSGKACGTGSKGPIGDLDPLA